MTRTRPFLDRYRGDGETDLRDLYDARLFREEIFLPVVGEVATALASFDVSAWSLPDPDGRLGATRRETRRRRRARVDARSTPRSATPARRPRCSARLAMDAPGTVAIVGTGGGRTTGVLVHVDTPVPGAAVAADALAGGRPRLRRGAARRAASS